MCSTHVRRVRPLLQLSLCMSSKSTTTLNNKLHVQASGHLSCHGFSWGWGGGVGGECNRSPLIISNTAAAERLKTKAQLRKELWGWSKPPLCVEMEDEKTLDSDCICDPSPLNLHPAPVSPASASSYFFFCHPFSLLLSFTPHHLLLFYFFSWTAQKCAICYFNFASDGSQNQSSNT